MTAPRAKFGPAAGASGGRAPYDTLTFAPEFMRLDRAENNALFKCGGMAGTLYLILIAGSEFKSGHVHTTYARLQAALRGPKPERGQWAAAPTLKQVRTILGHMEAVGLIDRDREQNAAQGQLRMDLAMRRPGAAAARATEARTTPKATRQAPKRISAEVRSMLQETAKRIRAA